ncbi:hypothetical protein, partial [Neisseria meningitidis]|uniref:hypothetical protein n=1 Tax=Neisseria meningitidis TaxID=487 RepID=UPI001C57FA16
VEPPTKKNTWLRNAKCFILESVPTTNTLVLHLKSESKSATKAGSDFFKGQSVIIGALPPPRGRRDSDGVVSTPFVYGYGILRNRTA